MPTKVDQLIYPTRDGVSIRRKRHNERAQRKKQVFIHTRIKEEKAVNLQAQFNYTNNTQKDSHKKHTKEKRKAIYKQ